MFDLNIKHLIVYASGIFLVVLVMWILFGFLNRSREKKIVTMPATVEVPSGNIRCFIYTYENIFIVDMNEKVVESWKEKVPDDFKLTCFHNAQRVNLVLKFADVRYITFEYPKGFSLGE